MFIHGGEFCASHQLKIVCLGLGSRRDAENSSIWRSAKKRRNFMIFKAKKKKEKEVFFAPPPPPLLLRSEPSSRLVLPEKGSQVGWKKKKKGRKVKTSFFWRRGGARGRGEWKKRKTEREVPLSIRVFPLPLSLARPHHFRSLVRYLSLSPSREIISHQIRRRRRPFVVSHQIRRRLPP